jgi:hypothetical protein
MLEGLFMDYLIPKHLLLFKAGFSEAGEAQEALQQWQQHYQRTDLDWTTRSILPLLVQRFPKSNPDFDRYRAYYQQTWLVNLVKFNKLNIILKQFNEAQIPVCLLKGSAMLLHYYKNMGMRPGASDIDLLIPKESLLAAMQILERHKMKPTSIYKHSGPQFSQLLVNQDEHILRFHHAINYNSLDMNIDLHWRMSPYLKDIDFSSLKPRMQTITLNQQPVYLLSLADHFIHTCFHGMSQISSSQKLWWLMDLLYLLDNEHLNLDWDGVYVLSKQFKVEAYVMAALDIVKAINPHLVPEELVLYYQQSQSTKKSLLQFKLQHHQIKLIKQLSSYYYMFYANQPRGLQRINPLLFMRFIQNYFGFTSTKEVMAHFLRQKRN